MSSSFDGHRDGRNGQDAEVPLDAVVLGLIMPVLRAFFGVPAAVMVLSVLESSLDWWLLGLGAIACGLYCGLLLALARWLTNGWLIVGMLYSAGFLVAAWIGAMSVRRGRDVD